ncbi:acyl-CoA dehydrogenase [Actinomadura craniellae]|uniref:Acyl-CoA dehydrogenase n=1 Tax=Actinomadura craniellae TaxID=2231787 RepID=A0A365HB44_9ACTN|nr:acyl-CoA dehydrogenase family protein [Actinomadura craniellae]RAY16305.1 acyl-CoA dehydrogenase [Actinomadura craniellae]
MTDQMTDQTTGQTTGSPEDDDRAAIRDLARRLVATTFPPARARGVAEKGGAPDADLDRELAAAGLTGLEIAEKYGGGGGSFTELAVVLEVLGEHVGASTLLSSAVLCSGALSLAGTEAQRERWLPLLAAGTVSGTAALGEWLGGRDRVVATRTDGAWTLNGRAGNVLDARAGRLLLIPACTPDGWLVALVEPSVPGLTITPQAQTDETRCLDEITLGAVGVSDADVLAVDGADTADATRLLGALANRAAAAVAADSVGNARRVLDMTVGYVQQRRQFNRPVGSFQAVKHQAADMLVNLETSAALVDEAARAVAHDPSSCDLAVSLAKDHACELAARNAGTALQLHGGIGYTWEHDLHLYLKRALLNEFLFGEPRWHRDRVLRGLLADDGLPGPS